MKNQNLTFKFSLIFAAFTFLTLATSSIVSYFNQTSLYKRQREESIQYVADHLETRVMADGDDFLHFHNYFMSRYSELKIELDFDQDSVDRDREIYETLFAKAHPGRILGTDIQFEELSDEIKRAYTIYNWEYYTLLFEETAKAFNIAYAYYIVPTGEPEHMYWPIVNIRESDPSLGEKWMLLNEDVVDPHAEHQRMWEAWETGKRPAGYDTYDNKYGKTYAYYTPLFINGQKLGVIGVEVEIAAVNKGILYATISQMLMIGAVLVVFVIFLLAFIRSHYIKKLALLRDAIEEYSQTKNALIAGNISRHVTNKDEICSIMSKFADMVYEIESYIKSLTKTREDLQNTKKRAVELGELAVTDSLTGIRNKTGYDREVKKVEWELADGKKKFGVAMIDLNFLKRINDTYGHDKGNVAIISLCKIVCEVFKHSPVFRIGGDEFAVILRGRDLNNIAALANEFNNRIQKLQDDPELEYWQKTSAAIGYAVYDSATDAVYENVFKRADAEMYKNKKAMKAVRED